MSLADTLGYHLPTPTGAQRTVQRLAATRPGSWAFAQALPTLDTLAQRVAGKALPEVLAGLPVLQLTTTGRRTGRERTSHLCAFPHGQNLGIVGTNFGQTPTPGWVHNLESTPAALAHYRGRECAVVARPSSQPEREAILAIADRVYPGYRAYRQRISGRAIRVFVLEEARG